MFPTDNTYVPAPFEKPQLLTIEQVREHGRVVYLSNDGTKGTVEVKMPDGVISYCACLLNRDGTIYGFVPRPTNTFTKVAAHTPVTEEKKESE